MRNFLLFTCLILLGSCNYNANVLFKADKDYAFAHDSLNLVTEYRISPHDKLSIRVYSNSGSNLMDVLAGISSSDASGSIGGSSTASPSEGIKVDAAGNVRLPMVGDVRIAGMTTSEAEKFIEDRYNKFYVDPFVLVNVINKRILVFSGQGGNGQVVNLVNDKTTLIEAIAMSGGIGENGKASSVRLVRKVGDNFKVYHFDLSTVDGLSAGQMTVASNDIIYFDHVKGYTRNFTSDLSTILGLLTSMILIYEIFVRNQ